MNIAVDGKNSFIVGWLARFLGLPKKHPCANALRPTDVDAFNEGWEMCDETPVDGYPNRLLAFYGMKEKTDKYGQADVITYWADDDGNEMEDK